MEYLQKVRVALLFLEENLREPIALEDVAAHAGFRRIEPRNHTGGN